MSTYAMVDGVMREIVGWPVMVDGAVRELDGGYAEVEGAMRLVYKKYLWEKWSTQAVTKYREQRGPRIILNSLFYGSDISLYRDYSFNNTTGKFSFSRKGSTPKFYYCDPISDAFQTYRFGKRYDETIMEEYVDAEDRSEKEEQVCYTLYGHMHTAIPYQEYLKGTNLLEKVSSAKPNAYPENGEQDGFWYVQI